METSKCKLGNTINELENPEKYKLQRQRAAILVDKIYPEFHEDWVSIKLQAIEDLESCFEELVLEPRKVGISSFIAAIFRSLSLPLGTDSAANLPQEMEELRKATESLIESINKSLEK